MPARRNVINSSDGEREPLLGSSEISAQSCLSPDQCKEVFFAALKKNSNYAAMPANDLLHHTGNEGPYTAVSIMLTGIFEADPQLGQNTVLSVHITASLAAGVSSLLKKYLKSTGQSEEKLGQIIDYFEESSSFHNTFGNTLFATTQFVGQFLPGNLNGWWAYALVTALIAFSMITAAATVKILDNAREKTKQELVESALWKKLLVMATSIWDAGNNFAGGYSVFFLAANVLFPTLAPALAPSFVNTQVYGGLAYAGFKSSAWLGALSSQIPGLSRLSPQEVRWWDKKVEGKVGSAAYLATEFGFYLTMIQAGAALAVTLGLSVKALSVLSNSAYKMAAHCRAKDELSLLEQGLLHSGGAESDVQSDGSQPPSPPHSENVEGEDQPEPAEPPSLSGPQANRESSSEIDQLSKDNYPEEFGFSDSDLSLYDDAIPDFDDRDKPLLRYSSSDDLASSIEVLNSDDEDDLRHAEEGHSPSPPVGYSLGQFYWARKTNQAKEPPLQIQDLDSENVYGYQSPRSSASLD